MIKSAFLCFPFIYLFHPFPSWEDDPEGCLTNMFYIEFL